MHYKNPALLHSPKFFLLFRFVANVEQMNTLSAANTQYSLIVSEIWGAVENYKKMNYSEPDLSESEVLQFFYPKNYLIISLYVPVFLTALVANVLVIWVVIKENHMRK